MLADTDPYEDLRDDETVCGGCHLAHYRRLDDCPICKENPPA